MSDPRIAKLKAQCAARGYRFAPWSPAPWEVHTEAPPPWAPRPHGRVSGRACGNFGRRSRPTPRTRRRLGVDAPALKRGHRVSDPPLERPRRSPPRDRIVDPVAARRKAPAHMAFWRSTKSAAARGCGSSQRRRADVAPGCPPNHGTVSSNEQLWAIEWTIGRNLRSGLPHML